MLLLTVLMAQSAYAVSAKEVKRPNFVWLVSEDNSENYLKLYNKHGASMPNVEELARNGIVFNHAFSNAPVCSAARTTLALGAYTPRLSMDYHRPMQLAELPAGLKAISRYLMEGGYYASNDVKEDLNFARPEEIWDQSKKGADWRSRKAGQPFFHMQSWKTTHEHTLHFPQSDVKNKPTRNDPASVEVPAFFPDTELFRYTIARYLDNHQTLDRQMGVVIQKLKDDGLLEDTFIFYFGDHGGVLPGSKGYGFDRSFHVPLVVRIPENFRHLLHKDMRELKNTRLDGFVNFVDFAPTLLKLAGLQPSSQHDGNAFMGNDVSMEKLNQRQTAFGYADRFDEKYDLSRSLRKGKFRYIRSYWPFNPDALQASYRYKQAAMQQWKQYYLAGKLNSVQSAFFEPRPVEMLFDMEADPHETINLADNADYQAILITLRTELQQQLKAMPDLAFYPESWQAKHALKAPVNFGEQHKADIAALIDIADLQLLTFRQARPRLEKALASSDQWQRYWALITLSSFGDKASVLTDQVQAILATDSNMSNRARAAQFLAITKQLNPVQAIESIVAQTEDTIQVLEILNIATMLRDTLGYSFEIPARDAWQAPKVKTDASFEQSRLNTLFSDRISYLKN